MNSIKKMTEDINLGAKIRIPEKVSEIILQYVKKNELKPGDGLPSENQLSQSLGVSSRSIREAMKILQARGFIEILQGKGAFLIDDVYNNYLETLSTSLQFTSDSDTLLFNLMEVRKMIEIAAIENVALNRTEEDLIKLDEIISKMDKAAVEGHLADYNSNDVAFHKMIIDCGNNDIIIAFYNVLIELFFEVFKKTGYIGFAEEPQLHSHRMILDAIRNRDADEAKRLNIEMINRTEATLSEYVNSKK